MLFKSEAVLASSIALDAEKNDILKKLQFRISVRTQGRGQSNHIAVNVPNESIDKMSSMLPVLKSPTVLPLAEPGWSSLHSVVNEGKFWR